ncbi:hypothetical protein [Alteromonas stellipolaris]|uniref:hypothetical protein n=1 Tax=Alteromonas stellipolaris TaxID=233316 RepID=UPI002494DF84|nr:hypothetical protein [Alteromonas stellipolaris]
MPIKTICKFFKSLRSKKHPSSKTSNTTTVTAAKTSLKEEKSQQPQLSKEQSKIVKEWFTEEQKMLPVGTKFLHGGNVDFSFFPVMDKPIWLAEFQNDTTDFAYGKSVLRKYQTVFSSQRDLKLMRFNEENTAPLALKLGGLSIQALDQLLATFLHSHDGVDGLIGPSNNVMLSRPDKLLTSESYSVEKGKEFANFCQTINSTKVAKPIRLESGQVVQHFGRDYKVVCNFKVLELNCSIREFTSLNLISPEEALYHFAKLKKALTLIDNDGFLMFAPLFEDYGFIEPIESSN